MEGKPSKSGDRRSNPSSNSLCQLGQHSLNSLGLSFPTNNTRMLRLLISLINMPWADCPMYCEGSQEMMVLTTEGLPSADEKVGRSLHTGKQMRRVNQMIRMVIRFTQGHWIRGEEEAAGMGDCREDFAQKRFLNLSLSE